MNWSALKEYKCPKCGDPLRKSMLDTQHHCSYGHCDFSISEAKFDEIVNDRYKPKRRQSEDPDQRLSELNNLEL